jgi:hypothetical protein
MRIELSFKSSTSSFSRVIFLGKASPIELECPDIRRRKAWVLISPEKASGIWSCHVQFGVVVLTQVLVNLARILQRIETATFSLICSPGSFVRWCCFRSGWVWRRPRSRQFTRICRLYLLLDNSWMWALMGTSILRPVLAAWIRSLG